MPYVAAAVPDCAVLSNELIENRVPALHDAMSVLGGRCWTSTPLLLILLRRWVVERNLGSMSLPAEELAKQTQ